MSGKLDQSLEDILKTRRKTSTRGSARSRGRSARVVSTRTPSGGVVKTTAKVSTGNKKGTQAVVPVTTATGESKILVSGLPSDVSEQQIKDYFAKTIGPVKRVFLTYGPNGQSRGVSTIVFSKPGSAREAATQLNGVKVDNRAMKIEVIVGASQAPVPVPAKALGERIGQAKATTAAKNQPKSAVAANSKKAATRGSTKARRGRNAGRGKPKTAEELDAEMTDYFDATAANGTTAVNGAAQPAAASGDAGMEDEIM